MLSLHDFMPHLRDVQVAHIQATETLVSLTLVATRPTVPCSLCQQPATRLHSYYTRTIADLPWSGVTVTLHLRSRKFYCDNTLCLRKVFCERLPALVAAYGRRSHRAQGALQHIGLALVGRAGARLAQTLALPIGRTALLGCLRALPSPAFAPPRVLGVDDLALRKGQSYATLLVDLERHIPIDLLPDRTALSLTTWLSTRPGIEVICRDRSGAYAEGARQGAPHAIQIADRWHLLANCGDVLERVVLHHHEALRRVRLVEDKAPAADTADQSTNALHVLTPPLVPPLPCPAQDKQDRDARREAQHHEILTLGQQGYSTRAMALHLGLNRRTVQKYRVSASCPHPGPRRARQRLIDPFLPYLRAQWEAGPRDRTTLWTALRARGFTGSLRRMDEQLALWRRDARVAQGLTKDGGADVRLLPRLVGVRVSPRHAAIWLSREDDALSSAQRRCIADLIALCPPLEQAQALTRRFAALLRARDEIAFAPWLSAAETSTLKEFRDFAAGIRRDEDAVRAALRHPWSSGQVEGQVNRVKMLKRQTYGRAGFDLLRQRVLFAA